MVPTSSVGSIELDGILNAWTGKTPHKECDKRRYYKRFYVFPGFAFSVLLFQLTPLSVTFAQVLSISTISRRYEDFLYRV
jgi:hypothetical protein